MGSCAVFMTQFLEKKKGTKGGGPVAGGGQGGRKRNGTESCKTEEGSHRAGDLQLES